jgi:hypothetical protein
MSIEPVTCPDGSSEREVIADGSGMLRARRWNRPVRRCSGPFGTGPGCCLKESASRPTGSVDSGKLREGSHRGRTAMNSPDVHLCHSPPEAHVRREVQESVQRAWRLPTLTELATSARRTSSSTWRSCGSSLSARVPHGLGGRCVYAGTPIDLHSECQKSAIRRHGWKAHAVTP